MCLKNPISRTFVIFLSRNTTVLLRQRKSQMHINSDILGSLKFNTWQFFSVTRQNSQEGFLLSRVLTMLQGKVTVLNHIRFESTHSLLGRTAILPSIFVICSILFRVCLLTHKSSL